MRLVGAVDAQSAEEMYSYGKRLLAAGNAVGALTAFKQILAMSPNSVDALNGVGVSYDQLGRGDLAQNFYEAGLELDPTSPRLLNNLGYSLFLRGDWAAATIPLRSAAASNGDDVSTTARATLMLITERKAKPPNVELSPAPRTRVEPTSEGEQKLVFGPAIRGQR